MKGRVHIGTSGWMYKDWGKEFYPEGMKKGFLEFLSSEFSTVEVNSSFYHLPLASTFSKWRSETPEGFIFAVKLSRYVSHFSKLTHTRTSIYRFLARARHLKEKLGPILIQLPPWQKFEEKQFSRFIEDVKAAEKRSKLKLRFVIEPRHISFMKEHAPAVRKILKKAEIALVFPHSKKIPSFSPTSENILTNFVYVRFHGPSEWAASRYGSSRLAPWAARIREWSEKGIEVYVYFNNDIHGHAIHDARTLKRLVLD
ncbi:MAG: DUF72 domain-containing protein [Patescibacteria group bacterium]|nr:DUF72 domain-containing protein [Patescibacteria group bacterium]